MSFLGDRFELQETLGSGGMAVVYRAWDRAAARVCAVKVLGDLLSRDEEFRRRFRGEAQAVVSLTHPHIVAVYDWGEIPPHHYIAMEYVAGGTLQDLMRRLGPLREPLALRIAAEVAEALAYAHARDVVHRDIKPHNILLTEDGHAKVADFGIARTLDATQLTRSGIVMGSAHYISPEQARGEPASPASDLYGLGVVLYEMLAGEVPFTGEAPVAIALKHLHEPPPDLRAVRPVSEFAAMVVRRLLAKDPGTRYARAVDLAADLRRAILVMPDGVSDETGGLPRIEPAEAPVSSGAARVSLPDAASDVTSHLPAAGGSPYSRPTAAIGAAVAVRDTSRMPAVHPMPRRRTGWTGFILSAAVAACLVGLSVAAYRTTWLSMHVTVPSLIGRTVADAGQMILPIQLGVLVTGQRQDPHAAVGVVLSQDPTPGSQVLKGSIVRLTVSQGSGIVPSLEGLPVDQAAHRLEAAGLRLGRVDYTPDDQAASGTVIHQFQASGTHLASNGAVDVLVSQGPPHDGPFAPFDAPFRPRHAPKD
jgi:serine/threonine-protein kinase